MPSCPSKASSSCHSTTPARSSARPRAAEDPGRREHRGSARRTSSSARCGSPWCRSSTARRRWASSRCSPPAACSRRRCSCGDWGSRPPGAYADAAETAASNFWRSKTGMVAFATSTPSTSLNSFAAPRGLLALVARPLHDRRVGCPEVTHLGPVNGLDSSRGQELHPLRWEVHIHDELHDALRGSSISSERQAA